MDDSLPHVRQRYFPSLRISERGTSFLAEMVISLGHSEASTKSRPAPACTILQDRWTTTKVTVSFDRCSWDSMSELKAYETNPFGKQEIKISVQTLKEIDLVLFQLLLEERRDSVREDNPRGRRKKGAYITRHLSNKTVLKLSMRIFNEN
jgi:hypothetical protein